MQNGFITKFDEMENIWQHILYDRLKIGGKAYPIILDEAPLNPKSSREEILKVFFEKFGESSKRLKKTNYNCNYFLSF